MKPAIVIAHGSWHVPEHYVPLIKEFHRLGFEKVYCPRLPTSLKDPEHIPLDATIAGDTKVLRSTIESLADEGLPIILVMHSYGGVAGSNALQGLLWTDRQDQRRKEGVIHLLYVAALLKPAGSSLAPQGTIPPYLDVDEPTQTTRIKNEREAFYSDIVDDAEAQQWVNLCVSAPLTKQWDLIEYDVFGERGRGVEKTYVVCEADCSVPKEAQEKMAEQLGDERFMLRCQGIGHCMMVSQPEKLAGLVKEAWGRSELRLFRDTMGVWSRLAGYGKWLEHCL